MKTSTFIYTLILPALMFISGCNKEQPTVQKNSIQVSAKSKNIGALLTSFKVRMNSQLKTTDSIPADSVEWYLGATINYTYGDATAKGPSQIIDSCFVSLQISGSYVQFDDFRDLYNSVLDSIRAPFYSINDNDKHLIASLVTTTRVTSSQISFKVTSVFQYGNFSSWTLSFGQNDHWKWWNGGTNNGGYCDGPNQGTMMESDAAIQIQQKMFYRKGVPSGDFCFIPPFETVWIFAEDYPNPNHSGPENYYKYYMFWNSNLYSQFHDCLNPTEMNFYLTGTEHVVYTSREASIDPGARPPLLSLITLELSGDAYFPAYNVSVYLHDGYAHYGLLVQSGGNPDNL